ncbi:MAG: phospholipase D-like domain-containing protein [Anaerolineales bacterium]
MRNVGPGKKRRTCVPAFWLWVGLLVLLSACHGPSATVLEPLPSVTPGESFQEHGWIAVYFSQPDSPDAAKYRGGADEALAEAIEQARFQVDLAIYRLDLWNVRDALLQAHRRGVNVRVVTESDLADEEEIQSLLSAGIPVKGDQGPGLMHQKFMIIDQEHVWTGSMNYTLQGVYRNDNNLIHVSAPSLAENYETEFNEMFEDQLFGDMVRSDTPHPLLEIQGAQIETYFSPDDNPRERILALIRGAEEQILFLAFSFTSDSLAQAMIERSQAGVTVQGVLDTSQSYNDAGSEWERFQESGLDVRLDGNPEKMHHKCILIDKEIVITGSYNFTESAENKNDENVLIIRSSALADDFIQEFQRVFRKGRP